MATACVIIKAIVEAGGISTDDAHRVLDAYVAHRLVTWNAHDGYRAIHGIIYDAPLIQNALKSLNQAREAAGANNAESA